MTAHRWLAAALLATGAAAIALLVVHRVVGFGAGTHGRRGILLLVVVGSYGPAAAVLPANLPNVIMAGIPERSPGTRLGFFEYLLRFFPAGAMVRGAVLVYAARRLFPDQTRAGRVPATPFPAPDRREWHAAAPLAITLGSGSRIRCITSRRAALGSASYPFISRRRRRRGSAAS